MNSWWFALVTKQSAPLTRKVFAAKGLRPQGAVRYCGRTFTADEVEMIRRLIASDPGLNRHVLSRIVCDEVGWLAPDGRPSGMRQRFSRVFRQPSIPVRTLARATDEPSARLF